MKRMRRSCRELQCVFLNTAISRIFLVLCPSYSLVCLVLKLMEIMYVLYHLWIDPSL